MLMMAVVVALTMTVGPTDVLAAKKKTKKTKVEQQEVWPDGTPMDAWFKNSTKVDVATDHDHTLAEESLALGRRKTLHRGLAAIVRTQYPAIAFANEINHILGPWTKVTVFVHHLSSDEGCRLTLIIY